MTPFADLATSGRAGQRQLTRCRAALPGASFALAVVALGAAGLFVMDLHVLLPRALLGDLVLFTTLLALRDTVRIVGGLVGLALLVAHGVRPA
ncbi:hypothetical protein XarbCFBP7408_09875 [Xanthomonas arboricola pv. guizotiae]|uniref:Uncharacterized protein n=1 Tax=Xanthomonas arboricola pv. guizotiae TaxID=487867 RepID=A0A2S7A3D2_9XANT|nr:hypothetical protein XarbCFBP7409_09215 [Xanthomonas arboricola pv. guizotiae]PPU23978.1 hypothetical protein XarbCFBP7408_09875 [Xanthomonas arboricola pv. guizotiae]